MQADKESTRERCNKVTIDNIISSKVKVVKTK